MQRLIGRGIGLAATAFVLALCVAESASADLSCSYDGVTDSLTVTSTGFEEVVALRRDGTDIEITNDAMGGEITCASAPMGLTPTINNTDSIELEGPAAIAPAVYFDLKRGYMSPGVENESPELSEIEIDVEWPNGFFGLGGGNNVDRFKFGESVLGPAVKMNKDSDPDAFLGTTETIVLRGESGGDVLSGKGGASFIGPLDIFMTIEGGGGRDKITGGANRDILYGEGGKDRVSAGDGKDIIEVNGGKKDKVDCGAGKDKVFADTSDEIAGDCEKVEIS